MRGSEARLQNSVADLGGLTFPVDYSVQRSNGYGGREGGRPCQELGNPWKARWKRAYMPDQTCSATKLKNPSVICYPLC